MSDERPPTPVPSAAVVADALQQLSELLELVGENPFKVRAYQRGAHAVRHLGEDFESRLRSKTLTEVENIGKSLVAAIEELVATGKLRILEEVKQKVPPGVLVLSSVPGLGPKKARQVCEELGISTLGELEYAATENRLLHLKGFGAKTQARILQALRARHATAGQCRLDVADEVVAPLLAGLSGMPQVLAACAVGQVRRRMELCHQVDLLCSAADVSALLDTLLGGTLLARPRRERADVVAFEALPGVPGVLHLVHPDDFAAAQLFQTGPEAHLRALASSSQDWRLTEQGARRGAERVAFPTEEAVYAALGLPWIVPELRDDGTEVDLARAGQLPRLIEPGDLRGALHNHTTWSDGRDTARAMQQAAAALGLRYLGISDHSQSAFYARGLARDALATQREELRAASERGGCELWQGVESDILQDGSLDYPAEVLAELDFVVASIHSRFQHDAQQMTQRLVNAARNPFTDVMGHPTGRLLLSREPYAFDLVAVLEAARESGCAMELNAQPQRLDLGVEQLKLCKRMGVKVCINADAHNTRELEALRYGVSMARRAGLTAADVVNTLDADGMRAWLRQRRERRAGR
ncbi:MAG: helix-hairpin-helix domain-containing protein [Myxococcota bacterium]